MATLASKNASKKWHIGSTYLGLSSVTQIGPIPIVSSRPNKVSKVVQAIVAVAPVLATM